VSWSGHGYGRWDLSATAVWSEPNEWVVPAGIIFRIDFDCAIGVISRMMETDEDGDGPSHQFFLDVSVKVLMCLDAIDVWPRCRWFWGT
jgi:hypothetical protein